MKVLFLAVGLVGKERCIEKVIFQKKELTFWKTLNHIGNGRYNHISVTFDSTHSTQPLGGKLVRASEKIVIPFNITKAKKLIN